MSFWRLQFQSSLGSPPRSCDCRSGAGNTDRASSLPAASRGSPCRLEFHLGRVACQMVSRNCVTGSQRSAPTRPHKGPESGGCRTGRAKGSGLGRLGLPQWTQVPRAPGSLFHKAFSVSYPPHPSRLSPSFLCLREDYFILRVRTRPLTSDSTELNKGSARRTFSIKTY